MSKETYLKVKINLPNGGDFNWEAIIGISHEALASINPAKAEYCSVIVNCPAYPVDKSICLEDFSICPESKCCCPESGINATNESGSASLMCSPRTSNR